MSGEQRGGFVQTGWTVAGDVYNVNGDLILASNGSATDFSRAIGTLRAQLEQLDGVPEQERREIAEELAEVASAATAPEPDQGEIVSRLSRVKQRLQGLSGAAASALTLANTVASLAHWAQTFF